MKKILVFCVVIFCFTLLSTSVRALNIKQFKEVSLDELKSHPEDYRNKYVRVTISYMGEADNLPPNVSKSYSRIKYFHLGTSGRQSVKRKFGKWKQKGSLRAFTIMTKKSNSSKTYKKLKDLKTGVQVTILGKVMKKSLSRAPFYYLTIMTVVEEQKLDAAMGKETVYNEMKAGDFWQKQKELNGKRVAISVRYNSRKFRLSKKAAEKLKLSEDDYSEIKIDRQPDKLILIVEN